MRILWVKAGKLLPVDSGGKIRSYNIVRQLANEHEVTFLSYYGGKRDPRYEGEIVQQLPGAHTIYTAAPESTLAQSLDYILRLTAKAPYAVTKFTHPDVRRTVGQWLSRKRFDVAISDFLSASLNFPDVRPIPAVLFQHNFETLLWQRMAKEETSPLRRLAYRVEAAKMANYERRTIGKFDRVIAVSDRDRDQMRAVGPHCPITVVPTGVDIQQYPIVPSAPGKPPLLVFTGSMDWEPNIDAVEYFSKEIWPEVLNAFPEARFQVVGRNPHRRIQSLASACIEVTGTVPSVTTYLRNATVVVVPLRIGGGTRLKIFEAMAMGKALVSTSIGAEGLDVAHSRDILLADDAASFAQAILQLLRDPSRRQAYEQAAAAQARRYDWSRIAERFADALRETITGVRSSRQVDGSATLPVSS
jgi:glycosyltransferase involved in cell wall biosynthesis